VSPALLDLLAAAPDAEAVLDPGCGTSSWRWDVPDGWQQGRGCWGGLIVGSVVRAAGRAADADDQRVRHVSAQVLAPVPPGPVDVVAEVLRRGSGTTTVSVRVLGRAAGPQGVADGEPGLLAHAAVVLGRARAAEARADGEAWRQVRPPAALGAGWAAVPLVPLGPPLAPVFLSRLALRPLRGFPGEGSDDGATEGWVAVEAGAVADAREREVVVCALVDSWWPCALVKVAAPRPMATLAFALDLPAPVQADDLVAADGGPLPLLHEGRLLAAREGYVTETRELWSSTGRLLAYNTQTMAVIR
jgi:acyl-coenzyme A thioesterase PaaI-like protein